VIEALEQVLADDALDGLAARPMDEVRALRTRCTEIESDVSLVRRVAQGRLDIIGHEARSRHGALLGGESDAGALPGLLFDLPSLMTDQPRSGSSASGARQVSIAEPGEVAHALVDRLDAIASPTQLSNVGSLSDDALRDLLDRMQAQEVELSVLRRRLHERIDALQAEIGRRYRDGEASVDSLFS
jgi:hypothetical protein